MAPYLAGILMILCAAALFGSLGPAERVAFEAGVTPAGVSFVRAVFGAVAVGCYAFFKHPETLRPGGKDVWKHVFSGLTGIVFVYYLSNIAFVTIPVSLAVLLFYTNPFWTVIGATVLGKERLTPLRVTAMMAGFIGVWVAVGGPKGGTFDFWGAFCAVASGIGYSLYMLNSRYGTGRRDPVRTFVQMFLWGAVLMTVITVFLGEIPDFGNLPAAGWVSLLHLAVFPTVFSYVLISLALRRIPSSVAAITSMSEILFATFLASFLLQESPTPEALKGGALIVGAVVILILEGGGFFGRKPLSSQ
ncbi:MAG: DMT family transporter [Thermovirgaceae bacterium]